MTELAARTGVAIHLATKDELVVTNTYGQQVVDTWALAADDVSRFASASHTWMSTGRLTVRLGDELVDTTRTPMLAIVGDTSGGRHDLLIPSCDVVRYRQLGVPGYHDNCRDNYFAALSAADIEPLPVVPQPLNLFMRVPVAADGSIGIEPPVAGPGAQVRLRALQDVVVVLSACPQDIAPTNGLGATPRPVEYDVVRAP
ncbi:DUF1989 domain-containing protein [Kribbella shirazensis]|uniref:DUF1989 domain-containing protein n=1 Tax=Kribbella shirazensis TaxID=1105143 RepID=A0A7X5VCL7_9ACTN|nr:urea carboxylase-associated family protein [Kribbella shirazensis]NIK58514.1 hypothetical protein [Kribbella shirazensis]